MTTSGSYSFSVTRDDIIRQAMLNIRRLDPHEPMSAEEVTDCSRMLNMMVKQWQGKSDFAPGLKVWTRKTGYRLLSGTTGQLLLGPSQRGWSNSLKVSYSTQPASQGATSVSIDGITGVTSGDIVAIELDSGDLSYGVVSSVSAPTVNFTLVGGLPAASASGNAVYTYPTADSAQKPLNIETVWLRDEELSDTPLGMLNVQDWSSLPNKQDTEDLGDPTAIYWEDGLVNSTLYLDIGAAQDVRRYIVMKYMEPVQDFVNPLDTPHYPQEWYLALCWGLSEQICPMFGANWTEKMEALKNGAMQIARNKGSENSTLYFQPGEE